MGPNGSAAGMITAETCPDCAARLPADAPAGLCPRCLLRLGAALSAGPAGCLGHWGVTGPDGHPDDGPATRPPLSAMPDRGGMIDGGPRIHLRETVEDAPLIRPATPGMPDVSGQPSRYQLVGELARGGMGVIFQGRDLELGRDLAVKVIREEHRDDPDMVRRFVEEAQIGGQLQHPGIVPVHDLGRLPDGRVFIAMKLVRGRTLAALLAGRRGPDDDRMRFLSDLRAGLPGDGLRPRAGRCPPGHEAVEHHGRGLRRGPGHGLGPGEGPGPGRHRRRGAVDPAERRLRRLDAAQPLGRDGIAAGLGARHAVVHGARTGPGCAGHAGRACGRLRPRLDPLRDPHRRTGLRGRSRRRGVSQGRSEPTSPRRPPGSTPATPTQSWWAWLARAWPPRRSTGRGTRGSSWTG